MPNILETWRQLFPSGGSDYVNREVGAFVSFYNKICQQIAADNHAVREAACACLAELAQKCSTTALEQEWERMMDALIDCFGDDSWPVRDATCIALGNFVRVLPNVTKPKHETLYEKFIENCTDPIASGTHTLTFVFYPIFSCSQTGRGNFIELSCKSERGSIRSN